MRYRTITGVGMAPRHIFTPRPPRSNNCLDFKLRVSFDPSDPPPTVYVVEGLTREAASEIAGLRKQSVPTVELDLDTSVQCRFKQMRNGSTFGLVWGD